MEFLPFDMVEKISKNLTPEDLARCCEVSTTWREIFNQDLLWKPYCDPELEEHLRTTHCVVEPVFVTPEGGDSTLAPISQWRLAFLRENHLRKNWERNNYKVDESVSYRRSDEFLTESHIVRWYKNDVEIWDVTVVPAKFVTGIQILDKVVPKGKVVDKSTLLFEKQYCVTVLEVVLANKCINFKHDIYVDPYTIDFRRILNGRMLLCLDSTQSKLNIYDVDTGNKVKEECCPVLEDEGTAEISSILSSPTSECVIMSVGVPGNKKWYDYVYSLKHLRFLLGPLKSNPRRTPVIHGNYFILWDESLKIYDYHTLDVIFKIPECDINDCDVSVFNGGFVFIEVNKENQLRMYSPINRNVKTLFESDNLHHFEEINQKFLQLYCWEEGEIKVSLGTWEFHSGRFSKIPMLIDFNCHRYHKVFNHCITKVLDSEISGICHYW